MPSAGVMNQTGKGVAKQENFFTLWLLKVGNVATSRKASRKLFNILTLHDKQEPATTFRSGC